MLGEAAETDRLTLPDKLIEGLAADIEGLNEILGEVLILPDIDKLGDALGLTDKLGLGLAPPSKKKKYFIVTL